MSARTAVRLPWDAALRTWGAEWEACVATCAWNPTLTPGWMDVSARGLGLAAHLQVVAVRDERGHAGFVPVRRGWSRLRRLPARVLTVGGGCVTYHRELCTRDAAPGTAADVFECAAEESWDVLRVDDVPVGGPTHAAIAQVAERRGWRTAWLPGERSPYLVVEGSWEEYLRTRSRKFRANVARALRRPSELGRADMRWYSSEAQAPELLDAIIEIERRSWKHALGRSIPARPAEYEYHRLLLPHLARRGMLLANVLRIDERPVGYVLACHAGRWIGQLKTSFDAGVRDAGDAVITASVHEAFARGAAEYDFLGHADPHKLKWTDRIRDHRTWLVFRGTPLGTVQWLAHRAAESLRSSVRPRPPASDGGTAAGAD